MDFQRKLSPFECVLHFFQFFWRVACAVLAEEPARILIKSESLFETVAFDVEPVALSQFLTQSLGK